MATLYLVQQTKLFWGDLNEQNLLKDKFYN